MLLLHHINFTSSVNIIKNNRLIIPRQVTSYNTEDNLWIVYCQLHFVQHILLRRINTKETTTLLNIHELIRRILSIVLG